MPSARRQQPAIGGRPRTTGNPVEADAGERHPPVSGVLDHRFSPAHRQALVSRLGRIGGNRRLQRLIGPPGQRPATPLLQRSGPIIEQPAPGEGGREYAGEGAAGTKAFSEIEKLWIDDVLKDPILQLIFNSYAEIPPVILHRLEELGGPSGQFSPASNEIGLSDEIYEKQESHVVDGEVFTESDEEAFKATLLHEIFHYLEHNAERTVEKMPLPGNLINALLHPANVDEPPYAFGWFIHPGSGAILHFQLNGIMATSGDYSIMAYPDLMQAYHDGNWERSPMPESGKSISIEEDLAASFGMALAGERTREALRQNYPRRYKLLDAYIRRLSMLQQQAAGEGTAE